MTTVAGETAANLNASRRLRQYELAERLGRIGHWYWRLDAQTIIWSPEAYRIHGVDPENFEVTVRNALGTVHVRDRSRVHHAFVEAIRSVSSFSVEGRLVHSDGAEHIVRCSGECERDGGGRVTALFGVLQDITEWRTAERALAFEQSRAHDFAELASDWLWETDAQHRFVYMSAQVEATTGVPTEFHLGKTQADLMGDQPMSLEMEMHLAWIDQHKPFRDFRFWREGPDGRRQYVSTSGNPVFSEDGAFQGYRGSARDMTEEQNTKEALLKANRMMKAANKEKSDAMSSLKEANALLEEQAEEMRKVQAKIQHTALHDPLTGIANRRYLDERLTEWAARCRRSNTWLAALHIDLDRFKQINDTAGHAAGDALLVHVARTLQDTVRSEDFVARIGGDEFLVLAADTHEQHVLSRIAERIIEQLAKPFIFEGRECWFGTSVGIAAMKGRDINESELMVNADIALYRAKSHGRGRYEFFSTEVQEEIVRNKAIADAIRVGLHRAEFIPYFQPQIDAKTFQISGFEALARWAHPQEGVLTPASFLEIAEELNKVAAIDRQILEQTLACYHEWIGMGLTVPRLSVNVSAKRLLEDDLIEGLLELKIPSGALSFELLESVFLDDAEDRIVWNIDMLKEMGIEVEMDDFGSGHASIVSLIKLSPDAIKIDRALIGAITVDEARRNLVRSIIEIGKSLNVRVVAEGVETLGHAGLLRDLGCDVLQGFVFSRPIPAMDVPAFIENWHRDNLAHRQAG